MKTAKEFTWLDWYPLFAPVLLAAVPDLHEFDKWIITIAPPRSLESPDTGIIFAIAKNPHAWESPAIYQSVRITSEDFAMSAQNDRLKDLIKAHLLMATGSLRMAIARLNHLDPKTMEPYGSSAAN
jgi:hypothetical protein